MFASQFIQRATLDEIILYETSMPVPGTQADEKDFSPFFKLQVVGGLGFTFHLAGHFFNTLF